ncbi:MAG: ABC transporter ATP-binding protein [Rhizobiaceae bacterium]
MSSDHAIEVQNLGKTYNIYASPTDRLKQMVVPRLQRFFGSPSEYFIKYRAVHDVSFRIARGETVGIIGRNGSGKSTLLQMICGTLTPSVGTLNVHGRIAALLELGAGFNPEFTGRENLYLNASIMGASVAETESRFDDIARFCDIGMFMDQPVKTYSSGMYVRLAFATAIHTDPDILIVDEALAVGDEAFQRKCYARISDLKDDGTTILFVSHSAETIVQLCDRAILMDGGEVLLDGAPRMVVSNYHRLTNMTPDQAAIAREKIRQLGNLSLQRDAQPTEKLEYEEPHEAAKTTVRSWFDAALVTVSRIDYEPRGALITNCRIVDGQGMAVNVVPPGQQLFFEYEVSFDRDVEKVGFGMLLKGVSGVALGGATTSFTPEMLISAKAGEKRQMRFRFDAALTPGTYFLNAGVSGMIDGEWGFLHRILDVLAIRIVPDERRIATGMIDFNVVPELVEI